MGFRVQIDVFRGPLDLLLYLVRKHEIDVVDLPIALVTEQYLEYLDVLEALDVDGVGEFIEMASTLIEIKSRMVLPRGGEEQEAVDDPRQDLVRQLLEYKKYKDAASILEERSRVWHDHFGRLADDAPTSGPDASEQPIREVELWDLVSAFHRVVRERQAASGPSIVYDDTPIHVYMERIHAQLHERGQLALSEVFVAGQHKSSLVGMFLAVLELVRHHSIRTEQEGLFGEVWLLPVEESTQFQPDPGQESSAGTQERSAGHPGAPEGEPDRAPGLGKPR